MRAARVRHDLAARRATRHAGRRPGGPGSGSRRASPGLPAAGARVRARPRRCGVLRGVRPRRHRPVRRRCPAPPRGRRLERPAGARIASDRRGSASPTRASRGSASRCASSWWTTRPCRVAATAARPGAARALLTTPAWTNDRSPSSSSRSSASASPRRPRSRRAGAWPRRSSRRTTRSSWRAASTRPTRPGRSSSSGRASASGRPTTSARGSSGRPAAAGSTRPSSSRSPRRSTRRRASATALADERRPLLRDLGHELHALPALRSTLARSFDPVGRAARHRVAPARRPPGGGPGRLRPAPPAARRPRRLGARRRRSRSRSSRSATAATWSRSGPTPGRGSRASSTTPRAAARRCSSSRSSSSSSATPGARRRSPSKAEIERILDELSAVVATNAPLLRETLDALARFDFWSAKAHLAAELDAIRAETADAARRSCSSARATRA